MDSFRVLVVDDETDFLETLVKRLEKRGIDATGVISGEEALETMGKKLFRCGDSGCENARRYGRH